MDFGFVVQSDPGTAIGVGDDYGLTACATRAEIREHIQAFQRLAVIVRYPNRQLPV